MLGTEMFPPVSSDYSALSKGLCRVTLCPLKAEPLRSSTLSKPTPKKMVKPGFTQNSRNLSCPAVHALSLSRAREFSVLKNGNSLLLASPHQQGPATRGGHKEGCIQMKPCLNVRLLRRFLPRLMTIFWGLSLCGQGFRS